MSFCMNCGAPVQAMDKFCAYCGSAAAPLQAQPVLASGMFTWGPDFAAALERERQISEAKGAYNAATQEKRTRRNRSIACAIAGVILAPILASLVVPFLKWIGYVEGEQVDALYMGSLVTGFFLAYAICLIWNGVRNHGFFIIFSMPFIIACLAILAVITIPMGLSYAIVNIVKAVQAKRNADGWKHRLEEFGITV